MHAASGEAAVLTPNPRHQRETKADDPMRPPPRKKFAQKQRRRRKRARRGPGPPSRRAPPPTGGGHPAGAAGCGAQAGASASLQYHNGSGHNVYNDARAPCSQSAKGYTFWPSSCSCAPPPLRVRAWYASPLLAPATSLSIILIACSPLLPPLRALPRQCLAAHRLLAAPETIVGEMCAAPPPWPPARPTLRVLWWPAGGDLQRMQALKRGPRHVVANIAFRVAQDDSHSAPALSPPPTPCAVCPVA